MNVSALWSDQHETYISCGYSHSAAEHTKKHSSKQEPSIARELQCQAPVLGDAVTVTVTGDSVAAVVVLSSTVHKVFLSKILWTEFNATGTKNAHYISAGLSF